MSEDGIWLSNHEQEIWRAFHHMRTQMAMALRVAMPLDAEMSEPDFEVLAVLSESPDHLRRARDLRNELQWEKSRLAHQVRRMEERGLVTREDCAEDSRAPMIRITEQGLARIRAAAPAHVARVRQLFFDALTPVQQEALFDASKALLARLAESHLTDS